MQASLWERNRAPGRHDGRASIELELDAPISSLSLDHKAKLHLWLTLQMTRIFRTGYVILPKAWKRYLEDGLGQKFDFPSPSKSVCAYDDLNEEEVERERKEEDEATVQWYKDFRTFSAYKARFRRIRRKTSWEVRSNLEIPHSIEIVAGEFSKLLIFIPTGKVVPGQPRSPGPSDRDSTAMTLFIDTANSLLPDDAARARAGFTFADMRFMIVPNDAVQCPAYTEEEVEEIAHLRQTQSSLVPT